MILNSNFAYSFKRVFFDSYLLFSSSSVCGLPSNAITCLQTACLGSWFVSFFFCMEGKGWSLRNKKKKGKNSTLQTPFPLQHRLRLTLVPEVFFSVLCCWRKTGLSMTPDGISLQCSCFCCFREAHHKDQVRAWCRSREKTAFQKYQHCLAGHECFAAAMKNVWCLDFRCSCLL